MADSEAATGEIEIVLADDHVVRSSLRMLLDAEPDLTPYDREPPGQHPEQDRPRPRSSRDRLTIVDAAKYGASSLTLA